MLLTILIDNRIRITNIHDKALVAYFCDKFTHVNPDYIRAKNMGFYPKCEQHLRTFQHKGGELSLPRGRLYEILNDLMKAKVKFKIVDQRFTSDQISFDLSSDSFELRDYQIEAIKAIMDHETCLIQGAPGSGKTEILLGSIAQAGLRSLILVHDKRLFNQWMTRIEKRLGIPANEIGTIGNGKKFKIGEKITVGMQISTRNRIKDLQGIFGFVALDEAHHAAAKTYLSILDSLAAKYRVGVSATIKRQDLRHFLTHDLFGPIAYKIERQDLEKKRYVQKVDICIVPTTFDFDYMNRQALKEICSSGRINPHFLSSESIQRIEQNCAEADILSLKKICELGYIKINHICQKDRRRIIQELGWTENNFLAYTTAAMMDKSRNRLILKYVLEELQKGSRCLLFTNRRHHCVIWQKALQARGIEAAIFWGTKGALESRRVEKDLDRLRSGSIKIGIGTIIDEGIDLPSVDSGFVLLRTAQHKGKLEQQAGRLARICATKRGARLFYFWDRNIEQFQQDPKTLEKIFGPVEINT